MVGLPEIRGTKVCAGRDHSIVLLEDGTLWSWGSNLCGQLGVGSNIDKRCSAMPIQGLDSVTVHQLCSGDGFGVALVERASTEAAVVHASIARHKLRDVDTAR